jgi:hypothetical protein
MNKKTRKFARSPIELQAQYVVEGEKMDWEPCTIINVSREGMGILFQTHKKIKVGSTIYLKMFVPAASEPINAKGILKWIKEEENSFIGGIALCIIGRGSINIL